ncbi:MAG TPA: response regulator [Bdellovibrionales bacterium]|nr:response regulator [Bdellovibrionales bacterium]|tara:strand:+ start:2193 stop:2609 length:417 start_codon:yes stop_codon:yes gene_type:complete
MSEPTPKERILVAEDSAPNRKILCHLLEKLGYEVLSYDNGSLAWNALCEEENQNVVAIISDIMMPEMSGIDLLKNVRGDEKLKDLPFVLVTAVQEKEYIIEAKAQKVNGYILKPVTFQRVTSKLQELFPNKKFPNLAA